VAAGVQSTLCHTVKCTSRNENKSSGFGGQKLKKRIKQNPDCKTSFSRHGSLFIKNPDKRGGGLVRGVAP